MIEIQVLKNLPRAGKGKRRGSKEDVRRGEVEKVGVLESLRKRRS